MKYSYTFYLLLFTTITVSSCDMIGQNHTASEVQSDVTLEETVWKLINFQDENGRKSKSGSSEIILIFHEDGKVSGTSSSNEYESSYSKQDSTLDIRLPGSTKVGELAGSKYWDYLPALSKVHSCEIHGNELKLYYGEKDKTLIFEAIARQE